MARKIIYKQRIAETSIESYLVKQVEKRNGICKKYQQGEGFPDRICIILHFGFLVETKTIGGSLSDLQKEIQAKLRKKGLLVYNVWTKIQVDKLMNHIDEMMKL